MATTAHWPTTATQVTHVSKSWPTPNHPQHAHVSRAPKTKHCCPRHGKFPRHAAPYLSKPPGDPTTHPTPTYQQNGCIISCARQRHVPRSSTGVPDACRSGRATDSRLLAVGTCSPHSRAAASRLHGFTASRLGIGSLASLADLTARRQLTPASKLAAGREPHPWPSAPTWSGMRRRKRADPRSSFRWLAADAQPSPTAP